MNTQLKKQFAGQVGRLLLVLFALAVINCADDEGTEADQFGVAAQCTTNSECKQSDDFNQVCLTNFAGGYCGIEDCALNTDCPDGSACVAHSDGNNYCFRICQDKAECNQNRDADVEANCSANITFTDPDNNAAKACVPPSSGV